MRFKIRKGMLAVKRLRLVEPTDVLVCARVLQALPQERLLAAIHRFKPHRPTASRRPPGGKSTVGEPSPLDGFSPAQAVAQAENLSRHIISCRSSLPTSPPGRLCFPAFGY